MNKQQIYLKEMNMRRFIRKNNIVVYFFLALFFFSMITNVKAMELTTNNNTEIKGGVVTYAFPEFYIENDILYTVYVGKVVILDCSDYNQLVIIGILNEEKDSSREILGKYNDILFTLRQQEKEEEGQTYYYTYFEMINVSKLSNPVLIGEVELVKSTEYGNRLYLHEIESKGYYVNDEDTIYYFIGNTNIRCIELVKGGSPREIENYYLDSGEVANYWRKMYLFKILNNRIIIPTINESSTKGFVIYKFTSYNTFIKETEWFGEMNISTIEEVHCTSKYIYFKENYQLNEIFTIENITKPQRVGYLNLGNLGKRSYFVNDHLFTINTEEIRIYNWSDLNNLVLLSNFIYNTEELGGFINLDNFNENKITAERIYLPITSSKEESETLLILSWNNTSVDILSVKGFPSKSITGLIHNIAFAYALLSTFIFVVFTRLFNKKKKRRYQ